MQLFILSFVFNFASNSTLMVIWQSCSTQSATFPFTLIHTAHNYIFIG